MGKNIKKLVILFAILLLFSCENNNKNNDIGSYNYFCVYGDDKGYGEIPSCNLIEPDPKAKLGSDKIGIWIIK